MLMKGDNVFYGDNLPGTPYRAMASSVIERAGLVPLAYSGIGLDVRASNYDREIREDLYKAKCAVILLGSKTVEDNPLDHWAMPELLHAVSLDVIVVIYALEDVTEAQLAERNLAVRDRVFDEDQFEKILSEYLDEVLQA